MAGDIAWYATKLGQRADDVLSAFTFWHPGHSQLLPGAEAAVSPTCPPKSSCPRYKTSSTTQSPTTLSPSSIRSPIPITRLLDRLEFLFGSGSDKSHFLVRGALQFVASRAPFVFVDAHVHAQAAVRSIRGGGLKYRIA
jgi:hypothetical protein